MSKLKKNIFFVKILLQIGQKLIKNCAQNSKILSKYCKNRCKIGQKKKKKLAQNWPKKDKKIHLSKIRQQFVRNFTLCYNFAKKLLVEN
jgi:hypothetical protein